MGPAADPFRVGPYLTGLASGAGAEQAVLRGLAVVAAVGGLAGYWAFLAWAIGRVSRHGLGKGRVLWWISAGCGGLAAAATAKVLGVPGGHWAVAFAGGLRTPE